MWTTEKLFCSKQHNENHEIFHMAMWCCDGINIKKTYKTVANGMHEHSDSLRSIYLYLRGRGADEFDAILQSSLFWIPFAVVSSTQSEYFPIIPPNKSLSCMMMTMMLMKLNTLTHTHSCITVICARWLLLFHVALQLFECRTF